MRDLGRVAYFAGMPRYLVERTFPDGLVIPSGLAGRRMLNSIITCNSDRLVNWVQSLVSLDGSKSFCIYDGPSPEAVRLAAASNGLPVDRITEIKVLDPYAYHT